MIVKKGSKVKVDYEGRFESGEVFDSSIQRAEPLEFVVGNSEVIPGFEKAVLGMALNEEKEVKIEPKDAYGERDSKAIQKIPLNIFPEDIKEGMVIGIPLKEGYIHATITKITNEEVTIDMNHPMAGKTLIFKIKVVEIKN